jgi:hypothetical protein
MHTALLTLMRLQATGWIRRQFSGGSVRRTIVSVLAAAMFLLWFSSLAIGSAFQSSMAADEILAILPPCLTAFALLPLLLGADDRAIAFTPAEVDFLFPGPFSRRDLVFFKLLRMTLGAILGGVFFAFMLKRMATSLPVAAAGAFMLLVFVNLLTMMVALLRDTVEERWHTLARRGSLALLLLGAASVVWYLQTSALPSFEAIKELADATPARVAFAPARVFAHVFAAESISEFVMWASACLGMIGGAVLAVLALDKGYMAAAFAASERRQARIARMGKGLAINTNKPARTLSIPGLGSIGPIGATIKRQLITAVRTSRAWMIVFAAAVAYGYLMSRLTINVGRPVGAVGLLPGLVIATMMLPQMLRFDFRGDVDHIEGLKSLPISPIAAAAAQLAVPTAILSAQGLVVLGGVAVFVGLPLPVLLMAAFAVIPGATLLIALENLVFLLLPTRLFTHGQANATLSGRRFLYALARMGLLLVAAGFIGGIGLVAWMTTGSPWATFLASWTMGTLLACSILMAVAWAFDRFDVSADMPT